MDTSKLPEARIERERYVLAAFDHGSRIYYKDNTDHYKPLNWVKFSKDATKFSTQQKALQAIEVYGRKYYNDMHTRPWEIWLITESRPTTDWVVDSERQLV